METVNKMILTVSLNPAIDKTCKIDSLACGKVNRLKEVHEFAGGKGINVTRILRLLDADVIATGFLGGYNGNFIEKAVEKVKAEPAFIHISSNTRVNTNIIEDNGNVTEILENGPVITERERALFLSEYEKQLDRCSTVVISGSLPAGIELDFYNRLIKKAKEKDKMIIVDTSSYPLKNAIMVKPNMIKPNINEMEFLVGKELSNPSIIADEAKKLVKEGIEHVVVSMGKRGSIYVGANRAFWAISPSLDVVNTVGCGDAMVAAYAYGFDNKKNIVDIIKLAVGVSAANTLTAESGVVDIGKAYEISEQTAIREID